MIVGSISENKGIEKRIAITPGIAKKYISNGFEVFIEKGLGEHLGISDSEFVKEGCKVETKETIISKSNSSEDYHFGLKGFLNEARMLAQFTGHPNIVGVRDFFEENDTAYLVMEYVKVKKY